jgi:hypothetical protein
MDFIDDDAFHMRPSWYSYLAFRSFLFFDGLVLYTIWSAHYFFIWSSNFSSSDIFPVLKFDVEQLINITDLRIGHLLMGWNW